MNRKYRKTVIAANWKMNKLPSEVKAFADELRASAARTKWCDIVVCVPFISIPAAVKAFKDMRVSVGAENVSEHASGAYTGEVSAAMLADAGVKYVIVGHSERRQYFGESDALVNEKARAVLNAGMYPIICVGETLSQREAGVTFELIDYQIKAAFSGIPAEKAKKCIVAYEPVWAIGTGKTATPEDANDVCRAIRAKIREMYGARISRAVTVQYGGSMNEKNAYDLLGQPDIDGGLIGGASLVPEKFSAILEAANQNGDGQAK